MHVIRSLEAVDKLQHVGVVELFHDLSFGYRISNLILLYKKRLLHWFHGVLLSGVELFYSKDFTKRAFSNQFNNFKVWKFHHLWCDCLSKCSLFSVEIILIFIGKLGSFFLFLLIKPIINSFSILLRSLFSAFRLSLSLLRPIHFRY